MHLDDLPTPALILDRRRLARNVARMQARAKELRVALRPHLKTAKSAHVAALATAGQPGGITVSTLREAAYFVEHGFRDLTYAVGIVPRKFAEVAALHRRGARVTLLTDCPDVASALGERASALGTTFDVLIEIDTGGGRAGIDPESPLLLEIARRLTAGTGARLAGVLAHAGHSYLCRSVTEVKIVAEEERAGAVRAAERLRAAGFSCQGVSVGSTPTALHAD
ncbi:MAG: alanine racemase, partial [Proteobacteria bacterium]|nr:alanine racemase [Pseudomonadota bacterium]